MLAKPSWTPPIATVETGHPAGDAAAALIRDGQDDQKQNRAQQSDLLTVPVPAAAWLLMSAAAASLASPMATPVPPVAR